MYSLLRSLLFRLPTETSHHLALGSVKWLNALKLSGVVAAKPEANPVKVMGLTFPNPVGLAAGLDKKR